MVSPADFVQIIRSTKKMLPSHLKETVETLLKVAPLVQKIDLKAHYESSPVEELSAIYNNLKFSVDSILTFRDNYKSFKPIYNLAQRESATQDLLSMVNNESNKDIVFDYVEGSISFKTEIVMKDIATDSSFNFGKFLIKLHPEYAVAKCIGENSARNGYFHPYVIKEKVCLGHYEEPYKTFMTGMQYFAAYQSVMQCLTLYGGDENNGTGNKIVPYQSLSIWIGQLCSVCDATVQIDYISLCNKTNRVICPKCIDTGECTDSINNNVYHPDVLKTCVSCKKRTSTVVKSKCIDCRRKALAEV